MCFLNFILKNKTKKQYALFILMFLQFQVYDVCLIRYDQFSFIGIECNFWQFHGLQTTIFIP